MRGGSLAIAIAALALFGAGAAQAAGWRSAPIVPEIPPALAKRISLQLADARANGNRARVFAKAGDSLTYSTSYLSGIACGDQNLTPRYEYLKPTIDFFARTRFPASLTGVDCGVADSFSRLSAATYPYMVAEWAGHPGQAFSPLCGPGETPVACEVRIVHPGFALVMFGTNDAGFHEDPDRYRRAMAAIITQLRRLHVIPILYTLPPRLGDPAREALISRYNSILYDLSRSRRVLLINLWRALQPSWLVNNGMAEDGIHLNAFGEGALSPNTCAPVCKPLDFAKQGRRYGYNQRNLVTLRTLGRLRGRVIQQGGNRSKQAPSRPASVRLHRALRG